MAVAYAAAATGEAIDEVAAVAWCWAERELGLPIQLGLKSSENRKVCYAIYEHYRIFPIREAR